MIVDSKGKKYVEESDIDFSRCPITAKLRRIMDLAELSYLSCESTEDGNKTKKLFGKTPNKDTITIAKGLGILEEPHFKQALALLKEVQEEIETPYVDLLAGGNYHKGPEYEELLSHYRDLRLTYWKAVALVANYKLATELTPMFSWL